MTRRTIRFVGAACIIVLVLGLALTPVLSAQRSAAQAEPDTVRALLQEVQLLRNAIERAVLGNSRMQLSLLRLNVEQQRVADLSDVLRGTQTELAAIAATRRSLTRELEHYVQQTRNREADPQRPWAAMVRETEHQLQEQGIRGQQLRTQENDAILALQGAEARVNELNIRLDQVDQLLREPPRR